MTYTYKKSRVDEGRAETSIIRKEDGACIPFDEANKDYREYLEWAKTNTAEAAD
jgi:hypothetical protein